MARRVALFVDGDNVSAAYASAILAGCTKLGSVDWARVYADAPTRPEWRAHPAYRFIDAAAGRKNASDLMLAVDAIELSCCGGYDVFVIASSDADFSHLARRLRERGHEVVGMGERAKAPECLCASYTTFIPFEAVTQRQPPETRKAGSRPGPTLEDFVKDVLRRQGGAMEIASFNGMIRKVHPVKISERPERTWHRYFTERPDEYAVDTRGKGAKVRLLRPVDAPS